MVCVQLLAEGVHLFVGGMDWNHHGGEFCTPVCVLYQLFWKCCVSLYMGFIALHLEHYVLHAIVVHVLQLLVGTNQSASEFCAWCQMFYDVEYCDVGNGTGIPKQQPHYFHCRNCTKCMSAYSSFVNVFSILITPLYYNTNPSC